MKNATRDAGVVGSTDSPSPRFRGLPGLTLIELAVVILALMLFATILLVGARAWKRGSDRAICIANIAGVQKAVRGFANMSGLNPGDTVPNLELKVVGPDRFFEALPACPAQGVYTLGGNEIPALGELYLDCSLATSHSHLPERIQDW